VRLDIDMIGTEQLLGPFDGQVFGDIDIFTTAIIPLARITLSVFVGQWRADSLQNGFADEIFRSDQFNFGTLATDLKLDCRVDFRINLGQMLVIHKIPPWEFQIYCKQSGDFVKFIRSRWSQFRSNS